VSFEIRLNRRMLGGLGTRPQQHGYGRAVSSRRRTRQPPSLGKVA